jgi:hypothetical protein
MLPLSWIDALFTRFENMYGQQFIEKWKNCDIQGVKNTWAEELANISGDTIKEALSVCKQSCKFPPCLPEFYQICVAVRKPMSQLIYQLPHHKQYSPEIAKENLEKMKEILSNSKFGEINEQN